MCMSLQVGPFHEIEHRELRLIEHYRFHLLDFLDSLHQNSNIHICQDLLQALLDKKILL